MTELSLLFDGGRLSVALRDDYAPQRVAKLSRHFLISRRSVVVTKANPGIRLCRFEEDAPAIVGHFHVIEMRPTFRSDIDRGAQPNVLVLKALRPHVVPPVEVVRQPLLQSALQTLVFRKIYVVRNAIVKVHGNSVAQTFSL